MAQFSKSVYVKLIEQKCIECIYDPGCGGGTWREQVQACTAPSCPLYGVRPLPTGFKHENDPKIPNLGKDRRDHWNDPTRWQGGNSDE